MLSRRCLCAEEPMYDGCRAHLSRLLGSFFLSLPPQVLGIPPSRQRLDSGFGAGGSVLGAELVELKGAARAFAVFFVWSFPVVSWLLSRTLLALPRLAKGLGRLGQWGGGRSLLKACRAHCASGNGDKAS